MTRPLIAITCGEPAGIGPEIAVKAWQALRGDLDLLWLGDPRHLPGGTAYHSVTQAREAHHVCAEALPVLEVPFAQPAEPGTPDLANAQGVIDALSRAVGLVQNGGADGLCTAPIHKKVLQDGAGFGFPGHTEFLAHLAGDVPVVMMLASAVLRVVPATIHIALSDVPKTLNRDLLRQTIEITAREMRSRFGIAAPRLAVAGLNPHAGEGGVMGHEEATWMTDLVATLQAEGHDLRGPLSADTMFHPAARRQYDVAICMYHDQALIPIKTLDFDGGVNVTLGLPFVRTSPDHGTAFDIAGKGLASPASMIAALRLAAKMAAR